MHEVRETAVPHISPRQIALTYDRVVSAHWRGETDTATALDAWFEAHWSDQAPPEPDAPPEGTSVLGDSGAGIRWYERDEAVLGYVSRRPNGCYRVAVREAVPALRASWDILEVEAVRQPDTDRLISDGERSAVQEPEIPDMHLTVQIFETTATENPSGVAAGS
ncbi:MAG: hypothetical protein K0S14_2499 [Thermomicrobiales bacterium]|jgi:hypothetical protein|nr:hypothetical protein [Thermomicrobiales bacterium]